MGKTDSGVEQIHYGLAWKAFAAKVDPAQLKTSVMDYLLLRMKIGLAHADITERMCDAWQLEHQVLSVP